METPRLEQNAQRAVSAGERYRRAEMTLAVFTMVGILVVLAILLSLTSSERALTRSERDRSTRTQELVTEIRADVNNLKITQQQRDQILNQIDQATQLADAQMRSYFQQLLAALRSGKKLQLPKPITITKPVLVPGATLTVHAPAPAPQVVVRPGPTVTVTVTVPPGHHH